MQLLHIERIVLVAETGNITEAANKLFISQPSLSQMISAVEREIGATIFDRKTSPLKLTPAGECFVRTAKHILSANKTMLDQIHSIKLGIEGKITIGASIPRCRNIMPHILPKMMQQYPHITLNFVDGLSQDFEQMILYGNVDLAISNVPPNHEEIGCHLLNEEHFYLVANRASSFAQRLDDIRYSANKPEMRFSINEAANEKFILLHPRRNSRIAFNRMCQESNLQPHICIEAYNSDIALEYVEANLGVAIISSTYSNIDPFPYQTKTLSYFAIDSKYAARDLYLFYDSCCIMNPAQKYLIELLLESFSKDRSEQNCNKL